MHRIDSDGSVNNRFSEGNPSLGVEGTKVTADWLNDVQEAIAYVIESSGLELEKGNPALLANAILSAIESGSFSNIDTSHYIVDFGLSAKSRFTPDGEVFGQHFSDFGFGIFEITEQNSFGLAGFNTTGKLAFSQTLFTKSTFLDNTSGASGELRIYLINKRARITPVKTS